MARPSLRYEPRSPAQRVLYQVVRDHLETFRLRAARVCDGAGLPRFVQEEFDGFLRCGFLAGGFARFQCEQCRHEHLLPFSCKSRTVCPSCAGRRMAERAAHLVDHVFPVVPVRQWVLTLPHRVRYVLAWDHSLCRAVMGLFMRTVLGWLRRTARRTQGITGGRSGAVVIVQRFGSALNLNVHGHALVLHAPTGNVAVVTRPNGKTTSFTYSYGQVSGIETPHTGAPRRPAGDRAQRDPGPTRR